MLDNRSLSYIDGPVPVPLDDSFLLENVERIRICDTGISYLTICDLFFYFEIMRESKGREKAWKWLREEANLEHFTFHFLYYFSEPRLALRICLTYILWIYDTLNCSFDRWMGGEAWYTFVLASQTCCACLSGDCIYPNKTIYHPIFPEVILLLLKHVLGTLSIYFFLFQTHLWYMWQHQTLCKTLN